MEIHFKHDIIPTPDGRYCCTIDGLGESISFFTLGRNHQAYLNQGESHLIIRRLRFLLMQRHLMLTIMGNAGVQKKDLLNDLLSRLESISLVPPERVYSFITNHKKELLTVCPRQRSTINEEIESIIIYAMKMVEVA